MSANSSSYSRASEVAEFSNELRPYSEMPVKGEYGQIAMLKKFSDMQQSVFRAELIQTMTKEELKLYAQDLRLKIENTCPNLYFKISFHLQGDATEKSSHIHIWGDAKREVEEIVQDYIYEKNLTVERNSNISFMEAGKSYKVFDEKVVESVKNEDGEYEESEFDSSKLFEEREKKEDDKFEDLMLQIDKEFEEISEILNINFDDIKIEHSDDIVEKMLKKDIFEEEE